MKYVACYCRVSTEEQVKFGYSIEAQKDALEKYCINNGYKYKFYIDEGISASSMKKRKELNKMLSKVKEFDMILFTKLDRLSRNVLDANTINKILLDNNCTMKAIDEDDIDTSTADGTFIFNLKVSLAQREIEKTSERINFVFANKREKGEVTSGQKKYGYDIVNKHFQINEEEAENIRQLYKYFISVNGNLTKTYQYFLEHFNGKGYFALKDYLRDSAYIGKYKLYRKNVYLDNYIPAIMDEKLFNDAQKLIKTVENKTPLGIEGLFTGLIYCPRCQHRFSKRLDNRVKTKKTIRYICQLYRRRQPGTLKYRCENNKNVREDYIEQYLLENISKEAKKYIIMNKQYKVKKKTTNYSNQINSLKKKLEKIKDLYIEDLIDKESYKQDYRKYSDEIKKLEELNQQENTLSQKDLSHIESLIDLDIKKIYEKLNRENKRKFWLSIIDRIYVDEGKIEEITFL